MQIIIPGDPIALARHRSYIRNGHIACYDSQASVRNDVRLNMLAQVKEKKYEFEDRAAYRVKFQFNFLPPKSLPVATKNLMLWGITPHTSKPDNSNVMKFFEDCGNNLLWPDDRYLIDEHPVKRYSNNPCTIIDIEIIKALDMKDTEAFFKIFSPEDYEIFINDIQSLHSNFIRHSSQGTDEIQASARLLIAFSTKWCDKLKKIKHRD